MVQFGISEVTARLLLSSLAQAALGIMMYFIFRHFSRVYIRRFLKAWSKSWLSFAIYTLSTVILTAFPDYGQFNIAELTFSLIAQVASFLHIIFILFGSYQLVYSKPISRKLYNMIITIAIVFGSLLVLIYSQDPEAGSIRYVLRLGSRALISGCGFLFAAAVVWMNPKFTRGYGQKLLSLSFLAFSCYQFFYLSVVFSNLKGAQVSLPGSSGLIYLMMTAMMSMGMVMWLLEDEREKLTKANKDLDSFLYSTSHDLRAPIASILGLTYLGKLELQEEKARNFMDLIEQRVKKLNAILTDILSLSRTKKLEVKPETLLFKDILDETISDIQFDESSSKIRLEFDRSAENTLFTDRNQMKIILSNLITNAIKYHRLNQQDPHVKICFTRGGNNVMIQVIDNGQGIPSESISRIFDMFYRASSEIEGTGLGLYIVREALAKIKGTIDVQSVFGKGTTFTITLPNV